MTSPVARLRIAGVRARTTNRTPERIGELWAQFHEQGIARRLHLAAGTPVYSVYSGYESDATGEFDVLVGCPVPPGLILPEGIDEAIILEGTYVLFPVTGPLPQGVASAWADVWAAPLARAYRSDFELYQPDGAVTIYVGIL